MRDGKAMPAARSGRSPSLRTRITLWYGAIIALCLLAFSAGAAASFTAHLRAELDRDVHEDIELAARALFFDARGNLSWPEGFVGKDIAEEEGGGHWIDVWSMDGEKLLATGTFRSLQLKPPRAPARPSGDVMTVLTPIGPARVMTQPCGSVKLDFSCARCFPRSVSASRCAASG